MEEPLSIQHIQAVAPHFHIKYLKCFAREYLLLSDTHISNVLNTTDDTLYELVYTGLNLWVTRQHEQLLLSDLHQLLSTACSANDVDATVLEVCELFNAKDAITTLIISKLARAFTQTQWKKFSTHYLSLGSESIEAFMGPHNMEDAQLAAARLLTTWTNLNGIDVSVAKLQEILEIAEKEGMVEKGTSKLLQQCIKTPTLNRVDYSQSTKQYQRFNRVLLFQTQLEQRYKSRFHTLCPIPWALDSSSTFDMDEMFITLHTKHRPMKQKLNKHRFEKERISMNDILVAAKEEDDLHKHIYVEGDPGSGKSTLCDKLAYDWSRKKQDVHLLTSFTLCIIFKVSLLQEDETISDIVEHQLNIIGLECIDQLLQQNQESTLYVIDGYDELRVNNVHLEQLIRGDLYERATVILTARPGSIDDLAPCFHIGFKLDGFNSREISEFLTKYGDTKTRAAFDNVNVANRSLRPLLSNPLYLWFFCILGGESFKGEQFLTRTKFFTELVNGVLRKAEKRLKKSWEDCKAALETLAENAYQCMKEDKLMFVTDLDELAMKLGFVVKHHLLQGVSQVSLRYIFVHKSILEFLTAHFIVNQTNLDVCQLLQAVPEVIDIKRKKTSMLLYFTCGLLGGLKSRVTNKRNGFLRMFSCGMPRFRIQCHELLVDVFKTCIQQTTPGTENHFVNHLGLECLSESGLFKGIKQLRKEWIPSKITLHFSDCSEYCCHGLQLIIDSPTKSGCGMNEMSVNIGDKTYKYKNISQALEQFTNRNILIVQNDKDLQEMLGINVSMKRHCIQELSIHGCVGDTDLGAFTAKQLMLNECSEVMAHAVVAKCADELEYLHIRNSTLMGIHTKKLLDELVSMPTVKIEFTNIEADINVILCLLQQFCTKAGNDPCAPTETNEIELKTNSDCIIKSTYRIPQAGEMSIEIDIITSRNKDQISDTDNICASRNDVLLWHALMMRGYLWERINIHCCTVRTLAEELRSHRQKLKWKVLHIHQIDEHLGVDDVLSMMRHMPLHCSDITVTPGVKMDKNTYFCVHKQNDLWNITMPLTNSSINAGDDLFSKAQSVWHYLFTEWAHANTINARVSAIGPLCKAICSLSEEQQSKIRWTDVQLTSKHDSLKAETLDNVEYTYSHIQLKKLKIVENNRIVCSFYGTHLTLRSLTSSLSLHMLHLFMKCLESLLLESIAMTNNMMNCFARAEELITMDVVNTTFADNIDSSASVSDLLWTSVSSLSITSCSMDGVRGFLARTSNLEKLSVTSVEITNIEEFVSDILGYERLSEVRLTRLTAADSHLQARTRNDHTGCFKNLRILELHGCVYDVARMIVERCDALESLSVSGIELSSKFTELINSTSSMALNTFHGYRNGIDIEQILTTLEECKIIKNISNIGLGSTDCNDCAPICRFLKSHKSITRFTFYNELLVGSDEDNTFDNELDKEMTLALVQNCFYLEEVSFRYPTSTNCLLLNDVITPILKDLNSFEKRKLNWGMINRQDRYGKVIETCTV